MSEPGSVSVVIPTHNRRRLLAITLDSVLRQRGVELDVTVVDDGSTDDTPAFLAGVEDPRVRVIRNETPLGVSRARNQGIDSSAGAWLAFVDDDDLWAPDKLARQLEAARDLGRAWVYVGAVEIDEAGRALSGTRPAPPDRVWPHLPRFNLVPGGCSGVIATREAVEAAGRWDPTIFLEDWDLWNRLGRLGPPAWVPSPLVGYRIHGGQASQQVDRILADVKRIVARYGGPPDRAHIHHYVAFVCLRSGQRARSLAHFALAALFGEPIPVIRNVGTIARARAARRFPILARRNDPQAEWKRQGEAWLSELR
jgi:glycosyltransferase involved in cell wall biosynthesis